MYYYFSCENCAEYIEVQKSIKDGPGTEMCPTCGQMMMHELGGNFILKGTGWPGKDLKSRNYRNDESKERLDHEIAEDNRMKRTCDEVLKVRRKGRKAVNKFKEEHPQKWKDYQEAMKKGVRGK